MDIKKICRKYNRTMREIAIEVGISSNNFGTVMRGNPTLATIKCVAKALNITPHELVKQLLED